MSSFTSWSYKHLKHHIYILSFMFLILPPFFLDVTLTILGSFKLDVTLLFQVITSLYLSPITCSHGTLLLFILSISLLSKNYLGVRDLKSVTSNKKRRKYQFSLKLENIGRLELNIGHFSSFSAILLKINESEQF